MAIQQQPLPYDLDALEPYISAETLNVHYHGHHKIYVDKLNKLIENTPYAKLTLEQIVLKCAPKIAFDNVDDREKNIFNNASQAWNHAFFWNCLSGNPKQKPAKILTEALIKNFGSKDKFIEQFSRKATDLFGSGWVWLAKTKNNKLEIFAGSNADSPLVHGWTPLLACDVWEHAYYIDYKNERQTYIKKYWEVVSWGFVEKCLLSNSSHKRNIKPSNTIYWGELMVTKNIRH